MTDETTQFSTENPAATMRDVMEKLGGTEFIDRPADFDLTKAHLVATPGHRTIEDLTSMHRAAAEYLKPARRKGTARLDDLQSLIEWANRFKGPTSALFAKPDLRAPTITCIADYHAEGPSDQTIATGDPTARHCHHRAIYNFPLSEEWKAWTGVSGQPLEKDDLGEFIEANAKDIMDPTAAILAGKETNKNQPWENRLIQTAQQIEGRYGQLTQLLQMSRQFQVYETSNLKVTSNRDTGEGEIQFLNEHKGADGKPLQIPNLIIIAIPVFMGGAPYRMPVRFRYRKMGGSVRFILSIYNPEKAFESAFKEAIEEAAERTELPTFKGSPES
ncbi:DUF2303 family protein [Antarcticimicrobium sediminis]|uniref:DUF2303 family protein n=1 Tax=Antarcticimicrobium sediminis TaxID=2546227 RepID=A0A4V2Z6V9_9RHOB|nr:DUF2303 family protein [Antarcticimicrobium sediminis]TDE34156.1 DUF2303 family protein [Antarcticimicrobium sediminis]